MELNRYERLKRAAGEENVLFNEPMKKHTSFHIGGPADCFVRITGEEQLAAVTGLCKEEEIPYFILGNGTNLLVSDYGFRGAVLQINKDFQQVTTDGDTVRASAGVLLSTLSLRICEQSLSGFEFASGIPGTLGGAVVMNAGAYGGEIRDVLTSARVLRPGAGIEDIPAEKLELGYRTSIFSGNDWIVLGAELKFEKGDKNVIEEKVRTLKAERIKKQPLDIPSAGSTFKRPEGYFAGKLIMEAGLSGFSVGDAAVSEKHCGFVVNKGAATALDVKTLIDEIIRRVKEDSGVTLVPEVRFLGAF